MKKNVMSIFSQLNNQNINYMFFILIFILNQQYCLLLQKHYILYKILYKIKIMNSHYENCLDIKLNHNKHFNPFILKIQANSTAQQHINLTTSAHILKKLSLVDISQSKQLSDLYKQCLLDVVQNQLLDSKSQVILRELLYYLQYWHATLGKYASWPHTRTCFYFLQDKLKKNKLHKLLDIVRLKRGELQPNKKDFLSRIMGQNVQSQQLKQYIAQLKQNNESGSEIGSINSRFQNYVQNNDIEQDQQSQLQTANNILYSDTRQDWKSLSNLINKMHNLIKQQKMQTIAQQKVYSLQNKINDLFEVYIVERVPVLLNNMRSQKIPKQKVLEELNFRKNIIESLKVKNQYIETLTLAISKILYNNFN